jgi:CIC family chloride channel protein
MANSTAFSDRRPLTYDLLPLALASLLVGIATGCVGAAFRISLDKVAELRVYLVNQAHVEGPLGLAMVIAGCAAATALAAWLVCRFAPHASGSGIPHTEAVLDGELRPAPYLLIPVKFAGGILAIGAGLALGREGPSVQMGASLAHMIGTALRRNWPDCRVLIAAGAGAGLATAFNAPIAGAVFVLEELVRRFETRIAIAALGASATAMYVARIFIGDAPDFAVPALPYPPPAASVLFLMLGIIAGLVAIAYNRTILGALYLAKLMANWPVELRAAIVGAAIGVIAWYAPNLVGGGEGLTQQTLSGELAVASLLYIYLLRFVLGAVSYAAKTPGGLFAPMLVLGAQLGILFAAGSKMVLPELGTPDAAFAVVGMAAFFTGVVRAPITGIVLITEMTGSFTLLLPMLVASFAAMLIPTLFNNPPIYDSLRELDAHAVD